MNGINSQSFKLIQPIFHDLEEKTNIMIRQLLIPNIIDLMSNSKSLMHLTYKANENMSLISEYHNQAKARYHILKNRKSEVKKLKEQLVSKRLYKEKINKIIISYLNLLKENNVSINTQLDKLQSKEIVLSIKEHYLNQLLPPPTIATDEESQSNFVNYYSDFEISQTGFIHNVNNSDCFINPNPSLKVNEMPNVDFFNISITQGNIQAFIQSYNHDRQMFKIRNQSIRKSKSFEYFTKRKNNNKLNFQKRKYDLKQGQEVTNPVVSLKKIQTKDSLRTKKEISTKKHYAQNHHQINQTLDINQLQIISNKILNESGINHDIEEFNVFNKTSILPLSFTPFYIKQKLNQENNSFGSNLLEREKETKSKKKVVFNNNKENQSKVTLISNSNQIKKAHQTLKQYFLDCKYSNKSEYRLSVPKLNYDFEKERKLNASIDRNFKKPKKVFTDSFQIKQCHNNRNINSQINTFNLQKQCLHIPTNSNSKDLKNQIPFNNYRVFFDILMNKLYYNFFFQNVKTFVFKLKQNNINETSTLLIKNKNNHSQDRNSILLKILNRYYIEKLTWNSLITLLKNKEIVKLYNENNQKKEKVKIFDNVTRASELQNRNEIINLKNESLSVKEKLKNGLLIHVEEDIKEDNDVKETSNDINLYQNSLKTIKEITQATQEIEAQIKCFANQMLNK